MDAMRAQSIPNGHNSYTTTRRHLLACHRCLFPLFGGQAFPQYATFLSRKSVRDGTVPFESGGSTYDTIQSHNTRVLLVLYYCTVVLVKYFEAQKYVHTACQYSWSRVQRKWTRPLPVCHCGWSYWPWLVVIFVCADPVARAWRSRQVDGVKTAQVHIQGGHTTCRATGTSSSCTDLSLR